MMNQKKRIIWICSAAVSLLVVLLLFVFFPPEDRGALAPGDFDYDGDVDGTDLAHFTATYAVADLSANLDSTGSVDAEDDLPSHILPDHDLYFQYALHQRRTDRLS